MSNNPWDVLPPPSTGDTDRNIAYASVGRALSQWEMFELHLSHFFCELIGDGSYYSLPARRAYGSVVTFRGRLDMIREAARSFTFAYDLPRDMEDIGRLLEEIAKFGARRNEIAHGIVSRYEDVFWSELLGTGYVLVPPIYSTSKQRLDQYGTDPRYIYSSAEIDKYSYWFGELTTCMKTSIEAMRVRKSRRSWHEVFGPTSFPPVHTLQKMR